MRSVIFGLLLVFSLQSCHCDEHYPRYRRARRHVRSAHPAYPPHSVYPPQSVHPRFDYGYRILLINKCKDKKRIGVRFEYSDGLWEDHNYWTVPGYSERYLRLDGVWVYTPNPEVYYFVVGDKVGEIGFRYTGERRWMRPAAFDHGEIVVRIPCKGGSGEDPSSQNRQRRYRPGL